MRFLSLLLKFLVLLFLVRLALRALAGWLRPRAEIRPSQGKSSGDLVQDRVCGTYILRDRALKVRLGGRDEHFCSAACRDRAQDALTPAS